MPNQSSNRQRPRRKRPAQTPRRARPGVTRPMRMRPKNRGWSNTGNVTRPMVNRLFTERGSDFLGKVTVRASPTDPSQRIIFSKAVSPSAYPGTRLTQLSELWERYRFSSFRLRWVPAVPKTIACQFVVYQDTDPNDDPSNITDFEALIRQATAQTGGQQFNFINPRSIQLARRGDDQLYYTGLDKQNLRFSRQGNLYIIQVTDPVDFNGAPLNQDIEAGSLYVDWICHFRTPQINPSAAQSSFRSQFKVASSGAVINANTSLGVLTLPSSSFVYFSNVGYPSPANEITVAANGTQLFVLNSSASGSARSNAVPSLPAGTYDLTIKSVTAPTTALVSWNIDVINNNPVETTFV